MVIVMEVASAMAAHGAIFWQGLATASPPEQLSCVCWMASMAMVEGAC